MRSETCSTSTPASACTAATICSRWSALAGVDRDVAHLLARLDADEVDRAEVAARVADRAREVGERAGPVVEVHAQRRAERGGGAARSSPPSSQKLRPERGGPLGGALSLRRLRTRLLACGLEEAADARRRQRGLRHADARCVVDRVRDRRARRNQRRLARAGRNAVRPVDEHRRHLRRVLEAQDRVRDPVPARDALLVEHAAPRAARGSRPGRGCPTSGSSAGRG